MLRGVLLQYLESFETFNKLLGKNKGETNYYPAVKNSSIKTNFLIKMTKRGES